MARSTLKLFSKGVDKQKRADIIFDLKSVDVEVIKKWSPEQKAALKEWLETAEDRFTDFVEYLRHA